MIALRADVAIATKKTLDDLMFLHFVTAFVNLSNVYGKHDLKFSKKDLQYSS